MKARDIFGLIVRATGLFVFLYGLRYLGGTLTIMMGVSGYSGYSGYSGMSRLLDYLMFGVPSLIIGILFMLCARHIVRVCYPDNKDDSDP